MTVPQAIGLAGKKECGKDEAGRILEERFGYRVVSPSEIIRAEINRYMELGQYPEAPTQIKEIMLYGKIADLYRRPLSDNQRVLQQWWGKWRRSQDEDYWVRRLKNKVDGRPWVNTSVRHKNEAEQVLEHGGIVILLTGRGGGVGGIEGHESERIEFPADYIIDNSGTLENLRQTLCYVVTAWGQRNEKLDKVSTA